MPMQLSKIKMSGFKSFVDLTTIDLPSQLVAVVGPNGCGKSNIIDAVTWVMGESSPKYLRGEASTDVIFNGSTARKPVGLASVELIFDNTNSTLSGEFAKFAEISVKRQINRESDSSYYINGVRCRKRDVVDIFLGTGLGPRSYSIIGQNMITRIVEAKPIELRTYLEEAAGISKYKERRHETELRINHTRENLARVNDVRGELEKQLEHLKSQANTAEKYKTLKQTERTLRGELYAVQWRSLDKLMADHALNIQREETALEGRNSDLSKTAREIEEMRNEQRSANEAFAEVQRRYYSAGNEITRIEQDILHHQEKQQQWENDIHQTENDWQSVKSQIADTEENLQTLDDEISTLEPELSSAGKEVSGLQNELENAENAFNTWQSRWDDFNQTSSKTAQTAQVEKTRISHLEQTIASLSKRHEQLQNDQGRYNLSDLDKEIEGFSALSTEMAEELKSKNQALLETRNEITSQQQALQSANKELDQSRGELQRLRGQQASLEALQQTALGQRDNPASPWIKQHNLGNKSRLAQHIEVEKGWELAVEKALGSNLQAICVDAMNEIIPHLDGFKSGNLAVFASSQNKSAPASHQGNLLIDKIKSPYVLDSLIAGVYVAETIEDALKLCESLDPNESVITRDGVWLNRSWLKILRQQDPAAGIFQREQELKQLALRLTELTEAQKKIEEKIEACKKTISQLEQKRDQLQTAYNQQQAKSAQVNAEHKMKQTRLTELKAQSNRFINEQNECTKQLQQANTDIAKARDSWQNALQELEIQANTREELVGERDRVRHQLQSTREQAENKKDELHELEIRLQTSRSQKGSLKQNIERMQVQVTTLNDRKMSLQGELNAMQPLDELKNALAQVLDKHVNVEKELNTSRSALETLEQEFKNLDEKRQGVEREINKIRSSLEKLRVDQQGFKVKADSIQEQMVEAECVLAEILNNLSDEITPESWQAKLDQTVSRINRLGPINLVAIDEYNTCLERKQYLDSQVEDLEAGLTTLEDAISKIDRETRARFKETFDKVNGRFQELFPTVFGGGKAYLELTDDNLLEAGVTMMACPPGKRNSSINLLSGGEKSLTAIALIFSIFYLNPAPFCLLDEVDAALDDANVLRFIRLVKVMAEKTQFIFISHNKITIEMGEQLIGVTMNEPGVSRLVSVDIEKAISMVETGT